MHARLNDICDSEYGEKQLRHRKALSTSELHERLRLNDKLSDKHMRQRPM